LFTIYIHFVLEAVYGEMRTSVEFLVTKFEEKGPLGDLGTEEGVIMKKKTIPVTGREGP
jgi:hypothetical protein